MSPKSKLIIAGSLFLITVARLLTWTSKDATPPSAYRHYEALGSYAAASIADAGPFDGKIVLVSKETKAPHLEARISSFLRRAETLALSDIEVLYTRDGETNSETGWTAGLWKRLQSEYPDVSVIVSFAGAPPASVLKGGHGSPDDVYFLGILPTSPVMEELLLSGWIDLSFQPSAIVPNPGPSLSASEEEWFNAYFKTVSSEDM